MSRAHSNIVAAAIRAAECIGLHEDGTAHNYSAVQVHVRRLLWYQLLMLDIRTCEATGPRPQVREGDFSARIPLNLDEHVVHLTSDNSEKWTDMTVTIIRMRCNEFIREIWTDRLRLQEKHVTISEILIKIQAFDAHMQGKYGKIADMNVPIQRYGCLVAKVLTLRTYGMVLHQYALHPNVEMPGTLLSRGSVSLHAHKYAIDNLKKIFVRYGVETMDAVQDLETARDLATWRWLAGAIQQHHYALAMLLELLKDPYLNQAVAILKGLDYVFEPPQHLGLMPLARVRCIVIEMRNRMKFYVAQRKLRCSRGLRESQELLDLERFDSSSSSSSSCTSGTSRDASRTPRANKYMDDQLSGTVSPYSGQGISQQISGSPVVPDFPQQNNRASQIQFVDMDMARSLISRSQSSID